MKPFFLMMLILKTLLLNAQEVYKQDISDDSISMEGKSFTHILEKNSDRREGLHSTIVPVSFIAYGFISLNSKFLKAFDNHLKKEIREEHPNFHTPIDNYLQYAPATMVYALNSAGIRGKNNFRDRTIIYLMANAMMGITVTSVKSITRIQRPDGYGHNAFPSGHTATAFVSAEFLRQEYKDVSPWYGVAGYTAATATAILRMYNNKHWFRDLLPGAGFGILSTRAAYWMYPAIKRKFFKDKPMTTMITPFYQDKVGGLSLSYNFNR